MSIQKYKTAIGKFCFLVRLATTNKKMDHMNLPKSLIERISHNNIVLFVGAGLSMNAGFPSWNTLIEKILDGLGEKEIKRDGYKRALNEDLLSPIEVLGKIEYLREYAIESFEKELRKLDNCSPTKIHAKLSKISTKIITTNYDCLLEKSNLDFEKIVYTNTYKVSKLSEYDKYIFKIHGDIHEPDKCILFPKEYDNLYSNEEKSSIFELKKIISDKSILFIGFSLSDPYIKYIFEYVTKLCSGFSPEHFILTTDSNKIWPKKFTPIIIENILETESIIDAILLEKGTETKSESKILEKIDIKSGIIIKYSKDLEYDLPPSSKYWVGRNKYLKNLSNKNFRVIFITGIGGQGKSTLAAQYLKTNFDPEIYEFGDWRDFKEETNRFQTKLTSIIKRLTNGEIDGKELEDFDNKSLVDTFFHYLGERKIVFVFDNVDSYIDLESFKPSGSLKYFFNQTMNLNHNSKFIFTCRPFIREAGINFYQISMEGLSIDESEELFYLYKISIKKSLVKELSLRAHTLTKGHPLWLNLIAGQAIRGIDTVNDFMKRIEDKTDFKEDDFSSILSQEILNELWNSINDKQRTLLRGIAETVKPETISNLKTILDSELNQNQFGKALNTLRNLNLIETKSSSISEDQIELHPLVKEFLLSKYPRIERAKFITLFVQYYDSFIYILKPKLSSDLSLSAFQNWTSKIELQINKGDFKPALVALQEVSSSILSAGFSEEFIRVAERLFNSINWNDAIEQEYSYFHSQFSTLVSTLTQFGKYEISEDLLKKYSDLIQGKSTNYLAYCSLKCYLYWFQERFDEAIEFGEEGLFLLDESRLTDNHSLRHNLSLAYRDSKVISNINKSLQFFLKNESVENVLDSSKTNFDLGGHFYGNIGKCLELLDKFEDALFCYNTSLNILIKEDNINAKHNIGYACSWISDVLFKNNRIIDGLYYLRFAINNWSKTSPAKAEQLKKKWSKLNVDIESKRSIEKLPEWKIENYCREESQKAVSGLVNVKYLDT